MKLFIWCEPYPVNYGASMYFAVAEDVEHARELACNSPHYFWFNCESNVKPNEYWKGILENQPDRIVELPCGEWHEVSE